jgi:hypothetical protein
MLWQSDVIPSIHCLYVKKVGVKSQRERKFISHERKVAIGRCGT